MKTSLQNRLLVGLIASLAVLQLSAHTLGHGTLTGSLHDGDTQEPIPHTNVVLLRATDQRLAAVGTTDASGNFRFARVPLGSYVVRTTVLGYQSTLPVVAFSPLNSRQKLGNITLRSLELQPAEVGQRQAIAGQQGYKQPAGAAPGCNAARRPLGS